MPGLVELSRKPCLRDRHAHGVAEALAQRPGGDFASRVCGYYDSTITAQTRPIKPEVRTH